MVEKIKVSLWDVYSFFLTGFSLFVWAIAGSILEGLLSFKDILEFVSTFSNMIFLFFCVFMMILFGMLFEPIANYFDRFIDVIVKKYFNLTEEMGFNNKGAISEDSEEDRLKKIILSSYMGELKGKISEPYQICKEYIEIKGINTNFMVFLSRYGFYRNMAFLIFLTIVLLFVLGGINSCNFFICFVLFVLYILMRKRSKEFYSYMAPTVYRCYLVEKSLCTENTD